MKHILFSLFVLVFNFAFTQVVPPKLPIPPPIDNYQLQNDSTTSAALKLLEIEKIPGLSISVSKYGDLIYEKGFGFGNNEEQTKVDPAVTQFRIASISKSLTAFAMAKLVDEGKLNFDKSIYTYLPKFPKKKYDFSVRQVGGHIAGIRHYIGKEFILNKKMTITKGLDIFKNDPLEFKPGSDYKYSTYGWNLLSEVIQKTVKQPFKTYMQEAVFNPLKMNNTLLEISDSIIINKTKFYRKTNTGELKLGPKVNNEFKAAGGGFLSTTNDLIKFGNEIINPTLVKKETVSELVTSLKTNDGNKTNYGIGFVTDKSKNNTARYSHSGGGIGATALLLIYPEENVVIAILTNLSNVKLKDFGNKLEAIYIN